MAKLVLYILAIVSIVLAGCAAPTSPGGSSGPSGQSASAQPRSPRTLVHPIRNEPDLGIEFGLAGQDSDPIRYFNAFLATIDQKGEFSPMLAESLPQLNTDTWRVEADGRMTTTYRLKPGLVWHDGAPLKAEDFLLGYKILKSPHTEKGLPRANPQNLMTNVSAPDDRTVVIEWSQPYVRAGVLLTHFVPRPVHILGEAFDRVEQDQGGFDTHPYWRAQYVHLGPYRITDWQPGVSIEAEAFDRYVFGKPKIEKVRILFQNEPNALVAGLLSNGLTLVSGVNFRSAQGVTLEQAWNANKGGTVHWVFNGTRLAEVQFRPEYAYPPILNKTVRKAIAHSIDREAMNLGLFDGRSQPAHHFGPLGTPLFDKIDRAVQKYEYDARAAERLLNEAGYTKGSDGFFTHPSQGQFKPEVRGTEGGNTAQQLSILRDGMRRNGIAAEMYVIPRAQADDREVRATFPGLSTTSNTGFPEEWYANRTTGQIASPATRWQGQRGGWSNAEYDRLEPIMRTTLDREQRENIIVEVAKIVAEELPLIMIYQNLEVKAHTSQLTYPWLVAFDGTVGWNVHEWDMN